MTISNFQAVTLKSFSNVLTREVIQTQANTNVKSESNQAKVSRCDWGWKVVNHVGASVKVSPKNLKTKKKNLLKTATFTIDNSNGHYG